MTGRKKFLALLPVLLLLSVFIFLWYSGLLSPAETAPARLPAGGLLFGGPAEVDPLAAGERDLGPALLVGDTIISAPSQPVLIDMGAIPAGESHGISKYERWQRGEVDLSRRKWLRDLQEIEALRARSLALPPDDGIFVLQAGPRSNAPALGTSFAAIDISGCCGEGGAAVPPDPELAVGPDHLIAVVNIGFQIYDKQGTSLLGPLTFPSLFNSLSGCSQSNSVFDPNVLYDEAADRFFLAIDQESSSSGSNYCVAVSKAGDPTGEWWLYRFAMNSSGATKWMDYPHAGIGRDAIYMGGNMFSNTGWFEEGRIWAFPKDDMYAGLPASAVERGLGTSHDTPQPANLHGYLQGSWPASGPHPILVETNFNGANHTLFTWDDPFGANTLTQVASINLNTATGVTAGFPVSVPQSGGGQLQANDWRPLDFEYRNGFGWTTMTVACNPGGGTVNCVRWARIDLANGTVTQAGVFSSDDEHRFFPDLAVNHCNDMAIGYTKSSASMYPGVWVTGRLDGDPAGTLRAEAELKAGEISYTAFDSSPRRWGDYTGMTIDPDGETFWYLGQYSKNTGSAFGRWGTYVGSFTFSSCNASAATPTPTPTPTNTPTKTATLAPTATNTPTRTATPAPTATMAVTPAVTLAAPSPEQKVYIPLVIR